MFSAPLGHSVLCCAATSNRLHTTVLQLSDAVVARTDSEKNARRRAAEEAHQARLEAQQQHLAREMAEAEEAAERARQEQAEVSNSP